MSRLRFACALLLVTACSTPEQPPAGDDSGIDSGIDSGTAGHDAGPSVDANADTGACGSDAACDDHAFCNGVEMCMPGSASADSHGCVHAPSGPCSATQTCDEAMDMCVTNTCAMPDMDHDGALSMACGGIDCDDNDPSRAPGHVEVCDIAAHDEDCDPSTFGVRDADGDGEADANCCNVDLAGTRHCGTDCDDTRAGVNTSAPEVCNGRDDDCDTAIDEGVLVTFWIDADGDLFGSNDPGAMTMTACSQPSGYAPNHTDCNDALAVIHPGAVDTCDPAPDGGMSLDEDCDGIPNNPPGGCACTAADPARSCQDAQGACAAGTETCVSGAWSMCSIAPMTEVCNGTDDNCDGHIDNGVSVDCYPDGDNDGYPALALPTTTCPVVGRDAYGGCPIGSTARLPTVAGSEDCNDDDASTHPTATEVCNGIDDNCNATVDEGLTINCYLDADLDGYALMGAPVMPLCPVGGACPTGFTSRTPLDRLSSDCYPPESDTAINGGQADVCGDGKDNDCDGVVDNGVQVMCWADSDNDSYAAMGAPSMMSCPVNGRPPEFGNCPIGSTGRMPATAAVDIDCNDADNTVHPGAVELCDAIDQNCNGSTSDAVMVTCYPDADDDGYSAAGATSSMRCPDGTRGGVGNCPANFTNRAPTAGQIDCWDTGMSPPAGTQYAGCVPNSITSAGVHPGAVETCQYLSGNTTMPAECDQDCSGASPSDEGILSCYPDADHDMYGANGSSSRPECPSMGGGYGGCVTGRATRRGDCNDSSTAFNPTIAETCDGNDQDCDGTVDEGFFVNRTYYHDYDGDTFGGAMATVSWSPCNMTPPPGYVTNSTDCNDTNSYVHPGQTLFSGWAGWARCTTMGATATFHSPCSNPSGTGGTWTCSTGTYVAEWDGNCDGAATPIAAEHAGICNASPCNTACTLSTSPGGDTMDYHYSMGTGCWWSTPLYFYSGSPACGSAVNINYCTAGAMNTCGMCTETGASSTTRPLVCR